MSPLLAVDTSKLPKPRSIEVNESTPGHLRIVVSLGSIRSARAWADALGIELKDTDPKHRYVTTRQESGSADISGLRVQVIGTEHVPMRQRVPSDAARAAARAGVETAVAV